MAWLLCYFVFISSLFSQFMSVILFCPLKGPWRKRISSFWRHGEQLTEHISTRVLMDRVGLGIEKMHCAMNPWTTVKRHVWLSLSTFYFFFFSLLNKNYFMVNYLCFDIENHLWLPSKDWGVELQYNFFTELFHACLMRSEMV